MGEVVQEGDGGCAVGQGAHDPRGKRRRNWGDCKGAATEGGRTTGIRGFPEAKGAGSLKKEGMAHPRVRCRREAETRPPDLAIRGCPCPGQEHFPGVIGTELWRSSMVKGFSQCSQRVPPQLPSILSTF